MKKLFNKIKSFCKDFFNDLSDGVVEFIEFFTGPKEDFHIAYASGDYSDNSGGHAVGYAIGCTLGTIQHELLDRVHNDVYRDVHNEGKYELLEYNVKDQLLHSKRFDGYERWFIYDSKGRLIYYKTSANFESWRTYDGKGNCITYKNSRGRYNKFIYDERGIVVDMIDITD